MYTLLTEWLPAYFVSCAALYKGFVNKKISDTINGVNAAGTAAQGLITNKGSLLGDRSKTLMGFITNLKQYVAAEAKDTVSDWCEQTLLTASALNQWLCFEANCIAAGVTVSDMRANSPGRIYIRIKRSCCETK